MLKLNPQQHYKALEGRFTFGELQDSTPQHIAHVLWDSERLYRRDIGKMAIDKEGEISLEEYWSGIYFNAVDKLGYIKVITGCMRSGKSKALLAECMNAKESKVPFMCFKPAMDTRDGGLIKSRSSVVTMQAAVINDPQEILNLVHDPLKANTPDLGDIPLSAQLIDRLPQLVIIDEAFMLQDSILDVITELSRQNIHIILATLNRTYTGHHFPFLGSKKTFEDLKAMAHEVQVLFAKCHECGGKAIFTQRFADGTKKQTADLGAVLQVGDSQYEPVCMKHFNPPKPVK